MAQTTPLGEQKKVTGTTRVEKDSLGEMEVPLESYFGASTMRAVVNFPISDLRLPRSFIAAMGMIKEEAAAVNEELSLLDSGLSKVIQKAAREVVDGALDQEFVIDVFQTGSGTSTNMNANEVIANRANELSGVKERGTKSPVHPNDHVNKGQSSNDVIPTAIHVAAAIGIQEKLLPALAELEDALRAKSEQFWGIIKTGRTHLQDATPIRLGQEFLGWAGQIERARGRCHEALVGLTELALGGTAVGTGVNTDATFASKVTGRLASRTGIAFRETDNHFQAQSTLDAVVAASAALRGTAVALHAIACNIRLLSCGPRAGLAEMALPVVQPGSSIMPGKVNPVILEATTMVAAHVVGNDATIAFANATGSLLELNVMMPVAAYNILQSIEIVANVSRVMANSAIAGIEATDAGPNSVERGLMTCTALAPKIGYDRAAALAKHAHATGKTIREVAREETDLTDEELEILLDPEAMTEPGASLGDG